MTTRPGGAQPSGWWVLPSKLLVPRTRTNLLPRDHLVARLQASDASVLVVTAGAGYGKTTLVRQWSTSDERPVAWTTVDDGDNDPSVLLRHVARALHDVEPMPAVAAIYGSGRPVPEATVVAALGAALAGPRRPMVLVLDDVHRITSAGALEVLARVIDSVPAGSQVALLGRTPPLGLARRVLVGDVLELRQSDLTFTRDEALAVLDQELPDLAGDAARSVVEWTEAWPAGIHLAVLALRDHGLDARDVVAVARRDRHVVDYFREECLATMPEDSRSFLLRTAVLERFTASMCDAVLDRSDGAMVLDRLVASGNLFVVDDEACSWYRYHHVFADLLLAELRRVAPGEEPTLRRRAAEWLSAEGLADAAVRQAVATGDHGFAARVLHRNLTAALYRGEVASVEAWIEALPRSARERDPLVALAAGWVAFVRFDHAMVEHWLAVATSLVERGAPRDAAAPDSPDGGIDLDVELAALRTVAGIGGVKQTAYSARIVREAGPSATPWWHLAWFSEVVARYAFGDVADPIAEFSAIEVTTRGEHVVHIVTLANLAIAHLLRHEDEDADAVLRRAHGEVVEHGLDDYGPVLNVHAARALVLARRRASDASRRAAAEAERLLSTTGAHPVRGNLVARLLLAEAAITRRDPQDGARQLALAGEFAELEPDAHVLHEWAERLAERLMRGAGLTAELTEAELRVLHLLESHLTLAQIAERLFVSRNTVKTQTISIYRKLGVSGRSAAVAQARRAGLLPS